MSKLKLMTIVGTRPEIIRLSAVIKKCDVYFDQLLVHTGQNYDYTLNQIFFEDLGLRAPDSLSGRRGRRPWRNHWQYHCQKLCPDGEGKAGRAADFGRHQQLPFGHQRKTPAHSHFPYGGGQPLL